MIFIKKRYITKYMKPEEREETKNKRRKQWNKHKRRTIQEHSTWLEDIKLNGRLKKEYDILQIDYSKETLKKVTV